eukprot:COSAG02_NODE_23587_length_714_cov_0.905691_1_plen_195_part_00
MRIARPVYLDSTTHSIPRQAERRAKVRDHVGREFPLRRHRFASTSTSEGQQAQLAQPPLGRLHLSGGKRRRIDRPATPRTRPQRCESDRENPVSVPTPSPNPRCLPLPPPCRTFKRPPSRPAIALQSTAQSVPQVYGCGRAQTRHGVPAAQQGAQEDRPAIRYDTIGRSVDRDKATVRCMRRCLLFRTAGTVSV